MEDFQGNQQADIAANLGAVKRLSHQWHLGKHKALRIQASDALSDVQLQLGASVLKQHISFRARVELPDAGLAVWGLRGRGQTCWKGV
eukprot:4298550-Amphidinium_carterae.1